MPLARLRGSSHPAMQGGFLLRRPAVLAALPVGSALAYNISPTESSCLPPARGDVTIRLENERSSKCHPSSQYFGYRAFPWLW